ncbi:MAG: 2-amino-4-hydroxy-6-hydroxymethyldihydropteridine diphosphokinase [Gammaproteobacteria bacterium]
MSVNSIVVSVYIGLGSNLDDPVGQIRTAVCSLDELYGSKVITQSSLYQSEPMGPRGQPKFINAVVRLDTSLSAHELLDNLQKIEVRQGRIRSRKRWGPRTLDLDILLFGNEIVKDDILVVPHPGLSEREFVLYPLYEIAPDVKIPELGNIEKIIKKCPLRNMIRIE